MNRYVFILILILCYFFSINNKMYACDPIAITIWNSDYIDEVTGRYWFFDGQNNNGDNIDVSVEAIVTVGTANVESWHWELGRFLYATEESDSTTGSSLFGIHSYRLSEYDYPGTYYLDVTAYNENNSVHDTNICNVCITRGEIESNEYIGYESSTDFTYSIQPGDLPYVNAYFYIIDSPPSAGIENYIANHIVYWCEISGFTGTVEWDGRGNYGSYESNNNFLSAGNYWAGIKIILPGSGGKVPQLYSFPDDYHPNLKIRETDLDADMDGDGYIDSDDDPLEENPGGYIGVGGSRKALEVYVGYSPNIDIDGHVKLAITAGNDKAKLYDSETGGSPNDYKIFNLATEYGSSFAYHPYLQANEPSEDPMDIEITLSYFAPEDTELGNPVYSDKVKFTSIEADLGVDVDGDSDIDDDDDSGEEFPGGYVVVNGDRLFLDVNLNLLSSLNGIVSINIYGIYGYDKVELYNTPTGGDKIVEEYEYGYHEWDLDDTTDYGEFNNICTNGLYIQGIAPSTYPQDIGITLTYYYDDGYNGIELCSDTVRLTALELKVYIDDTGTNILEDWPANASEGLLRSPKYIFGDDDPIYVEVKNVGNNPSVVEYVHVNVASESGGSANLKLTETGPNTNVFDNIVSAGELLYLAEEDSSGAGDKIKVIDEEVLTFSVEMPPYNSGNYQECYSVKVDRGESLLVSGSQSYNPLPLAAFDSCIELIGLELNSGFGWYSNGKISGTYYASQNLSESERDNELSKVAAINSGGDDSHSCSDFIQYTGHGNVGNLDISHKAMTEINGILMPILWIPGVDDASGWSDDAEFILLQSCESIAWVTGDLPDPPGYAPEPEGEIEDYWIGTSSSTTDRYFKRGIHAVLGYCDPVDALWLPASINGFTHYLYENYCVADAWKAGCVMNAPISPATPYAVVVRESNLDDYLDRHTSGNQSITRDSTQLAKDTTFIYYYYDDNTINYGPSAKSNPNINLKSYSDLKTEIDKIVEFSNSQEVDMYIISDENKRNQIKIDKSIKDKFDSSNSSDYQFTVSRRFDKLSSEKHTMDIDTEKLKSIAKESGLNIPDDYVLLSKGEMKAERFGNGLGSGEKWAEGEVFNFVKKYEDHIVFSDTCTIAVRNDEIMLYSLKDHPIQKSGKQRIKGITFNNTSGIDIQEINSKLVYEIKGNKMVPVWHVQYDKNVFKYDAVTGDSFSENL